MRCKRISRSSKKLRENYHKYIIKHDNDCDEVQAENNKIRSLKFILCCF